MTDLVNYDRYKRLSDAGERSLGGQKTNGIFAYSHLCTALGSSLGNEIPPLHVLRSVQDIKGLPIFF